jgi:hypothetical protein
LQRRTATAIAVCLAAAAVALMVAFGGKEGSKADAKPPTPGEPSVEIVAPRNGARQNAHAVVVKVKIESSARATSASASTGSPTASTR